MTNQRDPSHNRNREEDERSLLDQLLADSRLYKSSEDYFKLLEFIARMRNFAPFNALLLQIQKPGLQFAASRHDWRERFKAEVKEDARPLLILWPFGPVALVYDVVDLVSGNIPVDAQAFVAKGAITEDRIKAFIERMKAKDIAVNITDAGDGKAGSIQMILLPKDKDTRGCYKMKINSNHTPAVRFVTIAHELAHLFLGHLGEDKKWGIKDRRRCTHTQRELEAETVAFLVAKRNGVESRSETYLANYVRDNPTVDDLDFYQMTRAAGQIETLLGTAAHTRFDSPALQESSPEIFEVGETYSQKMPQNQIIEIMALADKLYDAGTREPADFAANLGKIDGGKFKQYSQAMWCLLRASDPALSDVGDWAEVYRSLESQLVMANPLIATGPCFTSDTAAIAPLFRSHNAPIAPYLMCDILPDIIALVESGEVTSAETLAELLLAAGMTEFSDSLWGVVSPMVNMPRDCDWVAVYRSIASQ